jgi:cation diffusion facilitator CzcD-associated flavoprotein CzcO/acetyl esterase/lipase
MTSLRLPVSGVRAMVRLAAPLLVGPSLTIEQQRRRADLLGRAQLAPRGTRVRELTLGGVAAQQLSDDGAASDAALLYLHGGGYCIGSPRSHRALAARLAALSGVPAYVLDYRLAPEHPQPAALDDAVAAYLALLESGLSADRIVVAGDSAGGGLALAMAMSLRDDGSPLPAALALICPWLDLVPDVGGTRAPSPGEALLTRDALSTWARAYVGAGSAEDPAISPLHGSFEGLPPLIVHSAADDLLASDSERLEARAELLEHRRLSGLWHDPHVLRDVLGDADEAVSALGASIAGQIHGRGPRVAIVGAGMSGICMGDALKQAGLNDFTVFEKADEVGGTWRENRYPGLSCDVPSRFYSFSFAPNPGWTSSFSPGPEIQRYFVDVSERRGLREQIRFGTEIAAADWEDSHWSLRTSDGERFEADVLVTATGVLHHPRLPEIPGMETFEGPAFHSARWDDSVSLAGKRVAVIGTGSTGIQITSAVGGVAERLLLFQRTPQWVLPIKNRPYRRLNRALMERSPRLARLAYLYNQRSLEATLGPAVTRPGWQRKLISAACRANLRFGIRDPELRARLTPDYEPMCKRLVMSGEFYGAMQRDDVELVTAGIERIEPGGILTSDGTLHEADVIVYATGFDAHAYMRPMEITGTGGVKLSDAWAAGPRAYLTVAIPGFPNMFTMIGPHSPIGNHSLIAIAETQAAYAMNWITRMQRDGLRSFAPTAEATDSYYGQLKAAFPDTVWVTGCHSWYLDADGDPELWPWTPARHRSMLAAPEPRDFVTR